MKKHLKQLVIIALMLTTSIANAQWTQIGQDIDGEAAADESGRSVSISADGSIVAIGAPYNDDGISYGNVGHVRIYKDSSGTWTQIGSDIDGNVYEESGWSVSLSADGTVVAIGASYYSLSNHVRIYKNISGTWTQIGSDIDGEAAGDNHGWSVSLSADGNTVAIGAIGNGNYAGHVRIHQYNGSTWTQIGSDIDGEAAYDYSGRSVSLNEDGSVVAIGAPNNDGNGTEAGSVRIYENIAGTWTQIGSDIDGEEVGDHSGYSVSLSGDGSIVAIGAPYNEGNDTLLNRGQVRIYKDISGTWTQIGNDIDGEAAGDESGHSVSISADGTIVSIGAPYNDGNGNVSGNVRLYQNVSGAWTQIGADIDGETVGDYSGWHVSLSSDGSVVAIGAYSNNDNGSDAGHVRIYACNNIGINELNDNITLSLYPNPTKGKITIQCDKMQQIELLDITGKQLYEQAVSSNMLDLDISTYSKGVYFIKVTTTAAVAVKQIVLE